MPTWDARTETTTSVYFLADIPSSLRAWSPEYEDAELRIMLPAANASSFAVRSRARPTVSTCVHVGTESKSFSRRRQRPFDVSGGVGRLASCRKAGVAAGRKARSRRKCAFCGFSSRTLQERCLQSRRGRRNNPQVPRLPPQG